MFSWRYQILDLYQIHIYLVYSKFSRLISGVLCLHDIIVRSSLKKHRGVVIRVLACDAEDPQIKNIFDWESEKLPSVHPVVNGYPTLFRAGEGEFRRWRERRWAPPFTCCAQWCMWNPNMHCPYSQLAMRLNQYITSFTSGETGKLCIEGSSCASILVMAVTLLSISQNEGQPNYWFT